MISIQQTLSTFHGWTTHNLALQLTDEAELVTINLPPHQKPRLNADGWTSHYFPKKDSSLLFDPKPTALRINQI